MTRSRLTFARRAVYGLMVLAAVSMLVVDLPRLSYTQTTDGPKRAPLNPAFVDFMNARARGVTTLTTAQGHALGLIPSPHFIPSAATHPMLSQALMALPSSYDLRTLGKLTSVKNQGSCGDCWAYATYGSLESYLLPDETRDFSEEDLNQHHGFSWAPCAGGNIDMSSAYLARWSGPIDQSGSAAVQKHVQNVIYLPRRASASDNQDIKQAVMTYGAVYVSFYWGDAYYNSTKDSYYCNVTTSSNHAVCIVGWNDNYEASNFGKAPAGPGAFIIKNSWGASWGQSGYFYVSYYDNNLGKGSGSYDAAVVTAEPTNNHTGVYQYDPLGWVISYGYGSNTAWGANIFTAQNNDPITAVSFYSVAAGTSYAIYIYSGVTDLQPRTGTLQCSLSGTTTYAGYYTVDLPTSVLVTNGDKFSVVVKFTTPGYTYPVPVEEIWSGYSNAATSSSGQSFLSSVGTTWEDISNPLNNSAESNVCIKAFAGTAAPPGAIDVSAPITGDSWFKGANQTVIWDTTGLTSADVSIQLMKGTSVIKSMANPTANDGSFSWTVPGTVTAGPDYFVRIRTTDGTAQGDSGLFSILAPFLTVTSPASGNIWYRGEVRSITWTGGTAAPSVKIQLFHGSTLIQTIASAAPNSGAFNWTIGKSIVPRTDYHLKLKTSDGLAVGTSSVFTLRGPTLTVTSPAGGSVWTRGSSRTIAWSAAGPQSTLVSIVLRRNGVIKSTIAASTDNDGSFDWLMPTNLAAGSGYDIRVRTADGVVKSFSGKFSLN